MKPPKRSKELSKQDKDGNPIWLKPERSKELEEILIRFYTLMFQAEESPMTLNSWGKKCVNEAITAIEKWAKERYGRS